MLDASIEQALRELESLRTGGARFTAQGPMTDLVAGVGYR